MHRPRLTAMPRPRSVGAGIAVAAAATFAAFAAFAPTTASRAGYQNPDAPDHEAVLSNALSSTGSCGVERWSVKTGTDADASQVNLSSTTQTTIASLASLPAPSSLPSNNRIAPTEDTVFQLSATLVEFKLETDSDYHLVLSDNSGDTMIAEIPDPACVGSSSPLLPGIQNARAEFDAKYTPNTNWQTVNLPVTVKGVGFFDYLHGQTGVAPNGIELHPVLNISFGSGGGGGNTVSVTNPGSQTSTAGSAASLQISASDSASGQTLTYAASGLPPGLSVSSGTGLISGTPTTSGAYGVTVTATDSTGASGSTSFTWTVNPSSGGSCTGGGQLLGNPGFETGSASPWSATSSVVSNSASEPPHSGSWDAWLDGYGTTHTDTLSQTVALPSGCTTYSLGFWLHIDTAETTASTAYDTLTVQVVDSSGTVLGTLATYSNLDANTGYAQHTFNLAAYAGQTVTIEFTGTEDYSAQTSFVLDDTSFNVS